MEQLIHQVLLKTHEYYNLKEAAQLLVDGLRERFMKRQLLIGGEKTSSDDVEVKDANTAVRPFARRRLN
jgi:hypothetical protein